MQEGEFVDVDLGGGQQQHQPVAPVQRDAAQQQQQLASACCVAATAAAGERLPCPELLRGGRGRAARVLALVPLGASVRQGRSSSPLRAREVRSRRRRPV